MTPDEVDPTAPLLVINPRASRIRDPGVAAPWSTSSRERSRSERAGDPWSLTTPRTPPGLARGAHDAAAGRGGRRRQIRTVLAILAGHRFARDLSPAGRARLRRAGIRGLRSAVDAIHGGDQVTSIWGWQNGGGKASAAPIGSRHLRRRRLGQAWTRGSWRPPTRTGSSGSASAPMSARPTASCCDLPRSIPSSPPTASGWSAAATGPGRQHRADHPGRVGPRRPIDPGDGRLDLLVVAGGGIPSALRTSRTCFCGPTSLDGTRSGAQSARSGSRTDLFQPVETDGDVHPPGWLAARVAPAGVTLLVPPARPTA